MFRQLWSSKSHQFASWKFDLLPWKVLLACFSLLGVGKNQLALNLQKVAHSVQKRWSTAAALIFKRHRPYPASLWCAGRLPQGCFQDLTLLALLCETASLSPWRHEKEVQYHHSCCLVHWSWSMRALQSSSCTSCRSVLTSSIFLVSIRPVMAFVFVHSLSQVFSKRS